VLYLTFSQKQIEILSDHPKHQHKALEILNNIQNWQNKQEA
jgi:hypothetical protein